MMPLTLWLLVGFLVLWMLIIYVSRVVATLWEILMPLIDSKPIDFRAKFGEWAVVTGSTDGIGKAYAKELAARNMNLVLISRTLEKLENTRDEILEEHPTIEVKIIVADFMNNVGMQYPYPMFVGEVPESVLWNIVNVNVGATTLMTRLIIGQMQKRGKGAIVNISSGSEMQPLPLMTVYAASKVYIKSFSEALRAEYSRFGLTIQHLTPFFVSTKMNAFSDRLQGSRFFVPNATTYAKNAINTLGKVNTTTGYWTHGIQKMFTMIPPVTVRTKIGLFLNESLRQDYFKQKRSS
ncbi:Inactive hydroxysteroid dehydrogenase-like protein 1 [Dufourea novaeangliae]|uniref:Inactive hydroxysteroid dehydrogenase-like protein 1 n=1 Tax=Dufourea novaeangliae TaxID=178035 RepID=A0A154PCK3_DUFNO|nr:Inactive hydroxysteroid dehydrogenase-like protein 1 [Dufourea novaeangliae]